MKNKNDKIYIILLVIIFVVILPICIFMSGKVNKKHEENRMNTISYIKEIFDFESINFSDQEITVEDFNKSTYIGIRHNKDGWSLFGSNIKNIYKPFTKDEVNNVDLIIFAISNYEYGNYKNATDKVTKLSSESVMLYYYNVKSGHFVIRETIEGEKLSESEKYSYDISDIELTDKVKKDLGL